MRTMIAAGALFAVLQTPAGAFFFPERPQDAPWCLNAVYSNTVDCAFESYRQCSATLEGIGGYCFRNLRQFAERSRPARGRRTRN